MLFIEWWILRRLGIALLMVGVAIYSVWFVRKKGRAIRLLMRFMSAALGLFGVLFLLTMWPGDHVYSVPLYSPDQKMAVRIDAYSPGEIGGPTYGSVELFSAHGFRSDVVFSGELKSVETSNLHWKSDSELEIYYRGKAFRCTSTSQVKVACIARPPSESSWQLPVQ